MLSILEKPQVKHNYEKRTIELSYFIDTFNLAFKFLGENIKLPDFYLNIERNEYKKLLNLSLELSGMNKEVFERVCRELRLDINTNGIVDFSQLRIKFKLNDFILRNYFEKAYYNMELIEELFSLQDNSGSNILLNLNNYGITAERLVINTVIIGRNQNYVFVA